MTIEFPGILSDIEKIVDVSEEEIDKMSVGSLREKIKEIKRLLNQSFEEITGGFSLKEKVDLSNLDNLVNKNMSD